MDVWSHCVWVASNRTLRVSSTQGAGLDLPHHVIYDEERDTLDTILRVLL